MIWAIVGVAITSAIFVSWLLYQEKKKTSELLEIKKNLKDLSELNDLRRLLQRNSNAVIEIRCLDADNIHYREPS